MLAGASFRALSIFILKVSGPQQVAGPSEELAQIPPRLPGIGAVQMGIPGGEKAQRESSGY